jgi:16S rRNA G966 N2-methylase RsmD
MAAELYVRRAKRSFDIIFLDPPFPYQFKWDLMKNLAASLLLANETKVLIHRPRDDFQREDIPLIEKQESREYGRSVVDFFKSTKK